MAEGTREGEVLAAGLGLPESLRAQEDGGFKDPAKPRKDLRGEALREHAHGPYPVWKRAEGGFNEPPVQQRGGNPAETVALDGAVVDCEDLDMLVEGGCI